MSKARLVITAVVLEGRSVAEVAAEYGVSRSWLYELLARYRAEGDAAFLPRSRRPRSSPGAVDQAIVDLILQLRHKLAEAGLDAGPDTIGWHLAKAGLVTPEPRKRPKSSYVRFEATMPNQTWQSDFTHYRLTTVDGKPGAEVKIISWLDDCTRYALHVSAHARVTGPIELATFRQTLAQHGIPASTLTDNSMVYTTRFAGGSGGRNTFENELRRLHITQKNSRPNHPTTCGKVERFQQTMKKWLRAQPAQPGTVDQLQVLIEGFVDQYNHHRPHRSLPHRATPAARYNTMPKAMPANTRDLDTHDRIRHDKVNKTGSVTLRHNGRLHHIGIGRTHSGTCVILLIQDLHVRVINAITGELLRDLTLNPHTDYQPTGAPKGPTKK